MNVKIRNSKVKSSVFVIPFQQAQAQLAQTSTPMPAITEGSYQPPPADLLAGGEHTHPHLEADLLDMLAG